MHILNIRRDQWLRGKLSPLCHKDDDKFCIVGQFLFAAGIPIERLRGYYLFSAIMQRDVEFLSEFNREFLLQTSRIFDRLIRVNDDPYLPGICPSREVALIKIARTCNIDLQFSDDPISLTIDSTLLREEQYDVR